MDFISSRFASSPSNDWKARDKSRRFSVMNSTPTKPSDSPVRDTVIRASWIAPMDQPAFRDGAIRVKDGWITAVGKTKDISTEHAEIIELPESILLPGLVNSHVHLELSEMKR